MKAYKVLQEFTDPYSGQPRPEHRVYKKSEFNGWKKADFEAALTTRLLEVVEIQEETNGKTIS